VSDYPSQAADVNRVEPVPRRVRAFFAGEKVIDTTNALYLWEWGNYPQFYIPAVDVRSDLLEAEGNVQATRHGQAEGYRLRVGDSVRARAVMSYRESPIPGIGGTMRFGWDAMDAWYEEDEQVFVHPRNPYVRVDALRSTRHTRIELDGVLLAESSSPVMVFETGLPTRYYVNRTDVHFEQMLATHTVTSCPYKGTTSEYWSVRVGKTMHADLAWAYNFPTRQLLPIAGLIAFYNEKLDILLDGELLARPTTHFFSAAD